MLDQLLCLMERYNSYESVVTKDHHGQYKLLITPESTDSYTLCLSHKAAGPLQQIEVVTAVRGKSPSGAAKELMGTEEWGDIEMFYEGKFEEARAAVADAREMMEEQL